MNHPELSGLKPGEIFTIAGVFCRRRDWFARLCGALGIRLYTQQLRQFRALEVSPARLEYCEVAALALVQKSTPNGARKPR